MGRYLAWRRDSTHWTAIEMAGRRQFIAGFLAASLAPATSWAAAGAPAYLSAAKLPDGSFALCGLGADRRILFRVPLPGRGHAAAAHPTRAEAVAFARRPGRFAIVVDCVSGHETTRLIAPEGRHFYGHGAFSGGGRWLFTTENDYEAGEGRVGVWDAQAGYARIDEFSSGGVGPHDIRCLSGSGILVIANGGIDTHPDSGRTKLNLPTMMPNLCYIKDSRIVETASLPPELHRNSIRHLAVSDSGQVALGMQWQGTADDAPLLGLHRRGEGIRLAAAPPDQLRRMNGYVGSVAFAHDQRLVAVTSPRGSTVQVFRSVDGTLVQSYSIEDASGIAASGKGFIVASGVGDLYQLDPDRAPVALPSALRWDNHLVAL